MSTVLIFTLLFIAFCLLFTRFKKTSLALLSLSLITFIAIGTGLIPQLLLTGLQKTYITLPQPTWKKNNAIVLLGAGAIKLPTTNDIAPTIMAYSRITETSKLYADCLKHQALCTVIVSGGDPAKIGKSEADAYKPVLVNLGIPATHIKLESKSLNTYQNAKFTSSILKKNHYDQVILVTSGIHLKRGLLYFSNVGIHAQPAMADYLGAHFSILPIGYNFAMADFAIHEYVGIAQLYIYNFLGLNS